MKKYFLKFIIFTGFLCFLSGPTIAADNCQPMACKDLGTDADDGSSPFIPAYLHGNTCFSCDNYRAADNDCAKGMVIIRRDSDNYIRSFWQCGTKGADHWSEVTPTNVCSSSVLKNSVDSSLGGGWYFAKSDTDCQNYKVSYTGDGYIGNSVTGCKCYYCTGDYYPSDDKKSCIAKSTKQACEDSGGTMSGSTCSCDSAKGLTADGNKCKCSKDGYEYNSSDGKCVKGSALKQKEAAAARTKKRKAEIADAKAKCEAADSGGEWDTKKNVCTCSDDKNLKLSGDKCVCIDDDNYKRDGNRCVLLDSRADQIRCTKTQDATWNERKSRCVCNNKNFRWVIVGSNKGECVERDEVKECNDVDGASWENDQCVCESKSKQWDANQKACVDTADFAKCTADPGAIWDGNQCVCTDPSKVWQTSSGSCVDSPATIAQRNKAGREKSLPKIKAAKSQMDKIVAQFGKSVWKTEDGKFNTSRLISDSIAGAVLGTAGGLITNNIMSKNQVKNGFEDIQCYIGDTPRASFGIDFDVNLQ